MKRISILIIALINAFPFYCQDSFPRDWLASIVLGVQAQDKRLYDFPPKTHLLLDQPEIFGTYQINVCLSRKLSGDNQIKLLGGLGFGLELSTFLRPFDHKYGKQNGLDILTYT